MSIMYCFMCGEDRDSDYVEFLVMRQDYMDLVKGNDICEPCSCELPENVEVE